MKTYIIGVETGLPAVVEKLIIGMLTAIEQAMPGTESTIQIVDETTHHIQVLDRLETPATLPAARRMARVSYRAIGGAEALAALGEGNLKGMVFKHCLDSGPLTARGIHERMPSLSLKAIESHVDKLCTSGLLQPEPIAG